MSFQADSSVVAGQLRAAALAIAAYEILWTIPAEYWFYKGSNTPKRALLATTRYIGIAALVANCALYFSSYDKLAACRSVHLLPGILQLFLGVVQQVVILDKTYEISRRCRTALSIMIFVMIITLPLEGIAVGLNREPILFVNELTKERRSGCLSLVREGVFNAGPVFYLSHLVFDISAISLCVYHLVRNEGKSGMPLHLIKQGVILMVLDAFVNTLTFLASLGISGIENIGSLPSTVTAVLVTQYILFMSYSCSQQKDNAYHLEGIDAPCSGKEYKHEVIALPHTMGTNVYKGSDAHFQSNGSLPQFANSRNHTPLSHHRFGFGKGSSLANSGATNLVAGASITGAHRSMPSFDGSTSVLHSCVGREALKYRVDGDTTMFQSKTSLSAPGTPSIDEMSRNPMALDVKRLSQLSQQQQQQQREAMAKRLSGRSIGRPTTAKSDDLSSTG